MKRLLIALTVCAALSCGSFAMLLLQDRQLGVPLPYSLPLALASMLVLGPALLMCVEKLRARRPIRIEAPPPLRVEPAPSQQRRAPVQGVVLLDFSTARARTERAA